MTASTLVRIEKMHSLDQVSAAGAHNGRSNAPVHANLRITIVTLRGGGQPAQGLLIARLQRAHIKVPLKKCGLIRKGRQPRRQRILALNVLCGVGEEFFQTANALKWAARTLEYLDQTFGADNVLTAELHLDERVPHLHAIVAPITPEGRFSASQVFKQDRSNEPEDLKGVRRGNSTAPFFRRLQREYHSLCREFDPNLTEPVPGGVMTHQMVSAWREWIARASLETPKLPQFTVDPPTPADRLDPQAYAQRQVDAFRQQAEEMVSTLHAKAVDYDQQVASNQHMQKTLRQQGKEITALKQQLLELQPRFRKMQNQQEDVSLHALCEPLGLPIEQIDGKPQILIPNGSAISVGSQVLHQPYCVQTWEEMPTFLGLASLFGLTESDFLSGLAAVMPLEQIERLVAYQDRFDLRDRLANLPDKQIAKLAGFKSLEPGSLQRLSRDLETNFGIRESWLNPGPEIVRNFEVAANSRAHLILIHKSKAGIDGIAVNGSKPSNATGTPFEQYLGIYQKEPILISSVQAQSTIVVSNFIEAISLLSVPELAPSIHVVVSGVTRLEGVAARALERPYPIVLIEYGSGRRCGRHRKLRELLELGSGKAVRKLCPSALRLGTAGFERIALDVQRSPALGPKLAQLIGLPSTGGKFNHSPAPLASQPKPTTPPKSPGGEDPSIAW